MWGNIHFSGLVVSVLEILVLARMPLVYVVCALILIHYAISISLARKKGRFVWMYEFRDLARSGVILAKYGYINGVLIFIIGGVLVFPPILIKLF